MLRPDLEKSLAEDYSYAQQPDRMDALFCITVTVIANKRARTSQPFGGCRLTQRSVRRYAGACLRDTRVVLVVIFCIG